MLEITVIALIILLLFWVKGKSSLSDERSEEFRTFSLVL
jgi:hypothetical protein